MSSVGPDPSGAGTPFRSVLLVGFMASGKTTVGRRLADRLGWVFHDADTEVERRAGASVGELFRGRGEAAFRVLEAEVTAELLEGPARVVASGGGWPAAGPNRLEALPAHVLTVWLRVPARVAVERAATDPAARPLLAVDDPEGRARDLIAARTPHYARARLHLDASDASVDALVSAIVECLQEARSV